MPDAAAETAAAASEKKPPPAVNPDRVGEELADDAAIWPIFNKLAKEDDERRTKTWDNGLNNLALFAGLFSAVTTAFIIEARQDLEPDYAQLTFLVLNATAFGEKPIQQPFVVPSSARTVNCLWISSLILSLSAALIAIMGKDWIGMYNARPVCNLRQWAEMRSYRLHCVEVWHMSGVIAAAPVLLHVSLLLFGAGLVLFISSDPFTHRLTLGLSLAAGALYIVTTFSSVIFSTSPFKSPATQMLRAAISALISYPRSVTHRSKRDLVDPLLRELYVPVVRHDSTSLPGGAPENRQWRACPRAGRILSAAGHATATFIEKIPAAATTLAGLMLASVRTARHTLRGPSVRLRIHTILSSVRRLPVSDWFHSSAWTDLPIDRRPELLAKALSWLSGASQAPDVFMAVVFALGDLDVGPQVGKHTSPALRTHLRADIRRTWQQVDFLTLARYVLADSNTPGDPVLGYDQFTGRFDLSKNPALRCEDGLAAVIRTDSRNIWHSDVSKYLPDQLAQPRMLEFLLPYMPNPEKHRINRLILLSNRSRKHLRTTNSFNVGNLEVHLYESLRPETRKAYATAITVKYGGTAGAIELLTFFCCHGVIDDNVIPAAVELVMDLLDHLPHGDHRCLAYLFGSSKLWYATWKNRHWSKDTLLYLSASLLMSCLHPCEPSSVRTLSDDRQFDIALARTGVMLLSQHYHRTGWEFSWIKFLFGHLSQSPLPSLPDNNEQSDIIRLIIWNAALLGIVGSPDWRAFHPATDIWSTAVLAAIICDLGSRLRDTKTTACDGEQLVAALAHIEVKGPDGETLIWDLGEWLRTRAPEIAKRCPSAATRVQDVYEALSALDSLCEDNRELRASWDRIGCSVPPEDIVYFCDPYLDLGDFFASAEDTLSRQEVQYASHRMIPNAFRDADIAEAV